jgi:hypothetical protein
MVSYMHNCTYGAIVSKLIVKVSFLKYFKPKICLELPVFSIEMPLCIENIRINLQIKKIWKNFQEF